jgi:hypothetical protein
MVALSLYWILSTGYPDIRISDPEELHFTGWHAKEIKPVLQMK